MLTEYEAFIDSSPKKLTWYAWSSHAIPTDDSALTLVMTVCDVSTARQALNGMQQMLLSGR